MSYPSRHTPRPAAKPENAVSARTDTERCPNESHRGDR
jgi:hypothetical protein